MKQQVTTSTDNITTKLDHILSNMGPQLSAKALIALVLPVLAASLALPNNTSSHSNSSFSTIQWSKCEGSFPLDEPVPDTVECGKMRVPLDHHNLSEDTIELGMMRLKAKGSDSQGTLFYNLGGPGEQSSKFVQQQAMWEEKEVKDTLPPLSDALRSSFDLIGVDMRGEGLSTPMSCDEYMFNSYVSNVAIDDDSLTRLANHNRAIGESCSRKTGRLFGKTGTDQRVRDLEMVRNAAVGDEKLNWIGWSYGSQLGIEYAEMFPERVGRFVLDGNAPRPLSQSDSMITNAVGADNTFQYFFEWCNTTSECVLSGQDLPSIWEDLVSAAEKAPLPAPACKENGKCFETVTLEQLIATATALMNSGELSKAENHNNFQSLAKAIKTAQQGDASGLSQTFLTSGSALTEMTIGNLNTFCSDYDGNSLRSAADLRAIYTAARDLAPRVRGISTSK